MTEEAANGRIGALGKQRPGRPVSEDLRGRAVAAVLEGGMSAAAAARYFGLGATTVRKWVRRFQGAAMCSRPDGGRRLPDRAGAGADFPPAGSAAGPSGD